jgi:hypothetical protein
VSKNLLDRIVPEKDPSGVIYGLILIGALLAAESGLHETYPETVGSALVTVMLYWFAHSYAETLGVRLAEHRRLGAHELSRAFLDGWSIVRGAAVPLLALVVMWALGASQKAAVDVGVWTAVISLVAFELAAGIRSHAQRFELALEVLAGATMGLTILALRAIIH